MQPPCLSQRVAANSFVSFAQDDHLLGFHHLETGAEGEKLWEELPQHICKVGEQSEGPTIIPLLPHLITLI